MMLLWTFQCYYASAKIYWHVVKWILQKTFMNSLVLHLASVIMFYLRLNDDRFFEIYKQSLTADYHTESGLQKGNPQSVWWNGDYRLIYRLIYVKLWVTWSKLNSKKSTYRIFSILEIYTNILNIFILIVLQVNKVHMCSL